MCAIHVIPSNPLLIPPHRPCACVWSSMIASTFICFSHSISTGRSSIRSVSTFRSSFIPLSCSKIRFTVPQFPAKRGFQLLKSRFMRGLVRAVEENQPLQAVVEGPGALNTLSKALAQRPVEQMVEAWMRVLQSYGGAVERLGKKFARIALSDASLSKLSLAAYDWAQ